MNSKEIYSKIIRGEYDRLVLTVDYDKMQKIIDNLQQRIDKAIEYIETENSIDDEIEYTTRLLDILRGEDNE